MLPTWVRVISVAVFVVSFVVGMALVSWYETGEISNDTTIATLIAIVVKGEAVSVVSAAIAGAFEGGVYIVVIAYEMVKRGFDRGRAEGRSEAYEDVKKLNADYYKRMQEARERGEEFNEPPPLIDAGENGEAQD